MSITSSFNAGVAGLNANAARLAAISDNIANSATFGYRRAEADFEMLVIGGSGGPGSYAAGGVRALTQRVVDQAGSLVSTGNALDLAVSGRGMLPVRDMSSLSTDEQELLLLPTGAFRRDEEGYLKTETGLLLLGWPTRQDGTVTDNPRDSALGLEPVRISTIQRSVDPTTRISLGLNLPASATAAGGAGVDLPLSVEYFGSLGNSERLDITFDPVVPATGQSNSWTMTIRDGAQGGAVVGSYTLVFDDTASAGSLASVTALAGGAYDPAEGTVAIPVAGGTIAVNIGRIGVADRMTQFDSDFMPLDITKNGFPVGSLVSLEIDEQGFVVASYDSGLYRRLYQIPLVDVPNVNGLQSIGRQAFKLTSDSGAFFLWDAGKGPTGQISGYTREGSATDIAAELTSLIQTQRAYASNAKVIQTVALSFAVATLLPVEISCCVRLSPALMVFMVCSATIALLLVRMEDMSISPNHAPLTLFPERLLSDASGSARRAVPSWNARATLGAGG